MLRLLMFLWEKQEWYWKEIKAEEDVFMAKLETVLYGDFDEILEKLEKQILNGNMSASLEDTSDFQAGDARCSVRVFERYSMVGGNRVSMNVTLFQNGDRIDLSAITSGGSQAVLWKLNTFGEEAFLDQIRSLVEGGLKSRT